MLIQLYISARCCDQIICILITPYGGLDCHVYFISFSMVPLWFWFIQTLFAGQTLHKVNNPTKLNLLSGHSQSIVMHLLTPFVFVSMKVLYHKTRQENQTFSLSGERKTNTSWENMIERTSGEQIETFSGLILRLFSREKVSTVWMCLFTEDKQSAQICQETTVCNQISKDFYMNFTSRQNHVGFSEQVYCF